MSLIRLLGIIAVTMIGWAPSFAVAADWQAGAGPEWKTTLDAARKEGVISVTGGQPDSMKPIGEAFERDTGIRLDALVGNFTELETRFTREVRADKSTIDVYFAGGSISILIKENVLQPVKPLLMLPEVTNPKNWRDGKLLWFDAAEQYMPYPNQSVFGFPLFDSNVIKPGVINTWQDLLKPEYKGKIVSYDPTVVGPGQAQAAYLADQMGLDYVKKLYLEQEVKLTRVSRQVIEWIARGDYAIALGWAASDVEAFRKEGMTNLVPGEMKDSGGSMLGGVSLPVVAKNNPHPNATKVFLNWYLSQPGQQAYADVVRTPSRRTDVSNAQSPDYVIPKPGVKYLDQYQEDWYWNTRPKLRDEVVKALGR
jgi:iron(III) transport system substrate-binding protein